MLALLRPSISMIDGEHTSWSRSSFTRGCSTSVLSPSGRHNVAFSETGMPPCKGGEVELHQAVHIRERSVWRELSPSVHANFATARAADHVVRVKLQLGSDPIGSVIVKSRNAVRVCHQCILHRSSIEGSPGPILPKGLDNY